MDIISGFLVISAFYLWFLFMDRFFKSCSHYGYIQFLKGTGLEIKLFQIRWTTTAFNKVLIKWGSARSTIQNIWFNVGIFASLLLFPIAIYIILLDFYRNFTSTSPTGRRADNSIIQPVMPGVNLPASEIGFYSFTLLISSIVHELGHAMAAVQEDVTVNNIGANIMFILPVAYVNLNSDKLFSLNPVKRLKILCAGVWHNLVVAFIAYLLYFSLPYAFSLFYSLDSGVIVSTTQPKLSIFNARGLKHLDHITRINDCDVTNEASWYKCLATLDKPGFCIVGDLVHNLDESVHLKHSEQGVVSCCHSENSGKLCFEYLDSKDSILEMPPYACLPGRRVIEDSTTFCSSDPFSCPGETYCFKPLLSNNTNLFKIRRKNDVTAVIYIGLVSDLKMIRISSYIPKYWFLSNSIPDVTLKGVGYFIVFSMGLAILNILPCLFTDGQHIINTLFHILCSKHLRTTHIKFISGLVTMSFTLLVVAHCVIVLWTHFH